MNGPTVPDDDKWPSKSLSQFFYECHDFVRANVVLVNLERQTDPATLGRNRYGTDHAETVMAVPGSLNGCFTSRCPSATVYGLKPKARFVNEYNACIASAGFFLTVASPSCANAQPQGNLAHEQLAVASVD